MKWGLPILLIFSIFILTQCTQQPDGQMVVKGNLKGGAGLQLYFDHLSFGSFNPLDKVQIGENGSFEFDLSDIEQPGIYRLRSGTQYVILIFDENEKQVEIEGDLANVLAGGYVVKGSPSSQNYTNIIKQVIENKKQVTEDDIKRMVDTTQSPMLGAYLAYSNLDLRSILAFSNPDRILSIHEAANQKLAKAHPNSEYVQDYASSIGQIKLQLSQLKIKIGQDAPDIALASPTGKKYSLSDLKGKVVLLDFWASWCRPCRKNNPEVVRIYNKYKEQGFTVYSVSLDGLDTRDRRRFQGNQKLIEQNIAKQKQRWEQAIQQDQLTWPYHVSDLMKWECEPAQHYGVTSIPKTFLLDREGKIAAINPHGASLEKDIQRLL